MLHIRKGARIVRPVSKLPRPHGWRWHRHNGPNSAHGATHKSGWLIQTVGSYSGSAMAMMLLLWSPPIYGPDETSTLPYRKAESDGHRAKLFETVDEAILFYENVVIKRDKITTH